MSVADVNALLSSYPTNYNVDMSDIFTQDPMPTTPSFCPSHCRQNKNEKRSFYRIPKIRVWESIVVQLTSQVALMKSLLIQPVYLRILIAEAWRPEPCFTILDISTTGNTRCLLSFSMIMRKIYSKLSQVPTYGYQFLVTAGYKIPQHQNWWNRISSLW